MSGFSRVYQQYLSVIIIVSAVLSSSMLDITNHTLKEPCPLNKQQDAANGLNAMHACLFASSSMRVCWKVPCCAWSHHLRAQPLSHGYQSNRVPSLTPSPLHPPPAYTQGTAVTQQVLLHLQPQAFVYDHPCPDHAYGHAAGVKARPAPRAACRALHMCSKCTHALCSHAGSQGWEARPCKPHR